MDDQRAPQRTRQLAPSRPASSSEPNEPRMRSPRSSSSYEDNGHPPGGGTGRRGPHGSRGRNTWDNWNNNWREFGDRVREFTGQMPLVGRVTGYRRRPRRIDDERSAWESPGFDESREAPRDVPDRYAGGFDEGVREDPGVAEPPGYPGDAGESSRSRNKRVPLRQRSFSIRLVMVLALLSVVIGFCFTQGTLYLVDTASAAADARAQVNAIEAIAKSGNVTDTEHLTEIQTRLVALNGDLVRLQGAIPGPIGGTATGKSLDHTLTMALKLVNAGRYGVDAALILVPHLKGALKNVGSSSASPTANATASTTATATATPAAPPGGLTMEQVTRAQQDIAIASMLVQQGLAERQYVNENTLSSVGLGSVVSILHKMDDLAPKLPKYFDYASRVTAALPDLLGVTKPAHFLLFNMDSDEMRSTGGFMGNYALITVQGGQIIGGVHLSDTFRFDCPGGTSRCAAAGPPIPDQYAWMNAFPDSFRMRDANISPDFPTSAKLVMQKYEEDLKFQGKSTVPIDGVIMITPEIIKDILRVTGSLTVDALDQHVTVSEANLQDVIHYFHIINSGNNTSVNGNSARKLLDAQLGSALLHQVGTLSAGKQAALMKSILAGFSTKDVQVYFNDSRLESLLTELHVDSTIPMPPGKDGLMVTDVDTGATYYSGDLKEKVVDTITFDKNGNAIHDMTITYDFPLVQHKYTPVYQMGNGDPINWYTGVTRVIVPDGSEASPDYTTGTWLATEKSALQIEQCVTSFTPSCVVFPAPEADHVVWAARINNWIVGSDSIIFKLKWITPKVLQSAGDKTTYTLQLYKQAGSHIAYDIKIMPPSKSQIAQPLTNPLKTPAQAQAGSSAEFTSPSLTKDTVLTVTFTGS